MKSGKESQKRGHFYRILEGPSEETEGWRGWDKEVLVSSRNSHVLSKAAVIKHSGYTIDNISGSGSFDQRLQDSQ